MEMLINNRGGSHTDHHIAHILGGFVHVRLCPVGTVEHPQGEFARIGYHHGYEFSQPGLRWTYGGFSPVDYVCSGFTPETFPDTPIFGSAKEALDHAARNNAVWKYFHFAPRENVAESWQRWRYLAPRSSSDDHILVGVAQKGDAAPVLLVQWHHMTTRVALDEFERKYPSICRFAGRWTGGRQWSGGGFGQEILATIRRLHWQVRDEDLPPAWLEAEAATKSAA